MNAIHAAHFLHLPDAADYRRTHGGWLWADLNGDGVCFPFGGLTPEGIFKHPLVKGRDGHLVCDNRFVVAPE